MRPSVDDVERYLDALEDERLSTRRLLEDLANIEDCPETDAMIRRLRHNQQLVKDPDDE